MKNDWNLTKNFVNASRYRVDLSAAIAGGYRAGADKRWSFWNEETVKIAIKSLIKRDSQWVLKKYFNKNVFSAPNVPHRVFRSRTSLGGNLQNSFARRPEEPRQAFDILHCRCKEELLTHELYPP